MAENKTQPTTASVAAFLDAIEPETRRGDAKTIAALMARLSGEPPIMWGSTIVGFGRYRYASPSGRTGAYFRIGFSPRKSALVLYLIDGFEAHGERLARLGKHSTSVCCLNLKKLADIDLAVLEELIAASLAEMDQRYPREHDATAAAAIS